MGVAEILTSDMNSVPWKERTNRRLAMAKEQIAKIGAEIMSGGELIDMVSLKKRASDRHPRTLLRSHGMLGTLVGKNLDFCFGKDQVRRRKRYYYASTQFDSWSSLPIAVGGIQRFDPW
jgi:hypothetical protein